MRSIRNTMFVLAGVITAGAAQAGEPDLAIRGVTIISPERAAPVRRADVFIENGKIAAIEPSRRHRPAASEIDGAGRFLVPGLIDSHVHLYHASGLKRRYTTDYDRLYAQYEEQLPRSALYFGYTTLVELNADEETNRQFEQASPRPDLYHCGQGLVISNDFMATDFEDQAEFLAAFPNFLHDRFTTPELPAGFDPAEHTPAATVGKIAASGGRCVKLYYEEALWWPGEERPAFALPSEAIVKEVISEAHRRNMPVLLHGTTPAAYRFAAATGVDIVAHGLWDWEGAGDGRQEIPKEAYAALSAITAVHIAVQPTLQTVKGSLSMFDPAVLDDPSLSKVLPADYIDYLRTDGQKARDVYLRIFGPRIAENYAQGKSASDDVEVIVRAYADRAIRLIARANRMKTHFLFGTDTAVGGFGWGNPPGLNGYWEMQDWASAGVPLKTIFKSATLDNARAFGLDKQIGSIEVGKDANLLLLGANPLRDIRAYDSIETVFLHGEAIERAALAADAPPSLVGLRTIEIGPDGERPGFAARVWYRTNGGEPQTFGASRIRSGYQAVPNGDISLARGAPLVILIHGSGGSADSIAWLGTELARRGALVVAADHPASSGGDPERANMLDIGEQPADVRHMIDVLLASDWASRFDPHHIAVAGFSLGGASALLLDGARTDFARFPQFCETHDDGACRAFRRHFSALDADFFKRANSDHSDQRIAAAIAIAPGFTEAMTPESLGSLGAPLLLIAGEADQQLPPQTHARPILPYLPAGSVYREIRGAQHFSFLPVCGPGAQEVLEETNEAFVCEEFGAKTRAEIHHEALAEIVRFLDRQGVLGATP